MEKHFPPSKNNDPVTPPVTQPPLPPVGTPLRGLSTSLVNHPNISQDFLLALEHCQIITLDSPTILQHLHFLAK